MFTPFSKQKLNYNSGQIFPFLIAVICLILVFLMITVNLGQIGNIKTDISNAADAAALAGVSVLSTTLVGLGAASEAMHGRATAALIVIIVLACYGGWYGICLAILVGIVYYIDCITSLFTATDTGRLGWSSAKKAAFQYAYNNAGVDEPRPTFNAFLSSIGEDPDTLTPQQKADLYEEYSVLESERSREKARNGFSRFMENDKDGSGYWPSSPPDPGESSPPTMTSGYGWGDYLDNIKYNLNSYDLKDSYLIYPNYVEVKVDGASSYPLELYSWFAEAANCLIEYLQDNLDVAWFMTWMLDPGTWVATLIITWLVASFIFTCFAFVNGEDQSVNKNPIRVYVQRKKRDKDLSLWKFRYGANQIIKAEAKARAYQEHESGNDMETIKSVMGIVPFDCEITVGNNGGERHLFETELQETY